MTRNITLKCQECDFSTVYPSSLRKHVKRKHETPSITSIGGYECEECGFSTAHKTALKIHIRRTHGGRSLVQPEEPSQLGGHFLFPGLQLAGEQSQVVVEPDLYYGDDATIRGQHKGQNRLFNCPNCGFATKYHNNLKRHIHLKSCRVKRSCRLCDFHTFNEVKLQRHEMRVHRVRSLRCEKCGYMTIYEDNLRRHSLDVHNTVKTEICDFEGSKMAEIDAENNNNNLEDDKVKSQCKFDQQNDLVKHDNDDAYECHMCYFLAVNEAVLLRHVQISHQ